MSKINIIDVTDTILKFFIVSNNVEINKIRRNLSLIETHSIFKVDILCNTSIFNDDFIIHRIRQIPLKELNNVESEVFELDLINNDDDDHYDVNAKDLISLNKNIIPVYDNINIIKLKKGEHLKLRCFTKKANGNFHANWYPITSFMFKKIKGETYEVTITTNGSIDLNKIIL